MTLIEITVEVDKKARRGFGEFAINIAGFEDEFYAELPKAMKRAQGEARKTALKPLREYPGPWRAKQSRFKWSNDDKDQYDSEGNITRVSKNTKARRWWFANMPNKSSGGVYQRTGALGRAWNLDMMLSSNNTYGTLRIYNENPRSSYVYGSEAFNWQRVPSHDRTGWFNAGDSENMSQAIESTFDVFFEEITQVAMMLAGDL